MCTAVSCWCIDAADMTQCPAVPSSCVQKMSTGVTASEKTQYLDQHNCNCWAGTCPGRPAHGHTQWAVGHPHLWNVSGVSQECLRSVTPEPHSTHQDSHRPGELQSSAYAAGRACANTQDTDRRLLTTGCLPAAPQQRRYQHADCDTFLFPAAGGRSDKHWSQPLQQAAHNCLSACEVCCTRTSRLA